MMDDLLSLFDLFDHAFPMYDRAHLPQVNLRRPKR